MIKRDDSLAFGRVGNYVIQGDPIPLARARHGRGRTWDSQSHLKHSIALQLQAQHPVKVKFHGPILMEVIFYMPIAQSLSAKKQQSLIDTLHEKKPDLSNLIKFIEDAAKSILYDDDCIICSIVATKKYDKEPRTEIIIKELR